MTSKMIELYLYMGSSDEIIKWLKSENVKTREEAIEKLSPYVRMNMLNVASHIGAGEYGVSLAGTSNGVQAVLKAFPEKKTKATKKKKK